MPQKHELYKFLMMDRCSTAICLVSSVINTLEDVMKARTNLIRRVGISAMVLAVAATTLVPAAGAAPLPDRNGDAIPDRWEIMHRLPLSVKQTFLNQDGDELFNKVEHLAGTNPRKADTDGDGVRDGLENPDGDSVANGEEQYLKTNPRKADTDGDGVADGDEDFDNDGVTNHDEFVAGTDPLSQCEGDRDLVKALDEERTRAFQFRKVAMWFTVADYFDAAVDSDCDSGEASEDEVSAELTPTDGTAEATKTPAA